ncbi:MAG: NTP transferase domain-containing protein [Candidatus Latescibacteria bacterium]|nr:NTP transferase domain-containing protein [Candidatus Latescibacterota bacterium]
MKGVVLAGGTGSRLYPLTKITNKHLLPVFDRPMIYYPIESLVEAGIEDIMIVTGGESAGDFLRLLGNGNQFGLKDLNYTYQEKAGGIAEALGLAEHFVGKDKVVVFLGDNIIEGSISKAVENFQRQKSGAKILLKEVDTPESYGVPEIVGDKIVRIEEKPRHPKSPFAVIGIYMYDSRVFDIIRTLTPSSRGELEITDVNNAYIEAQEMSYEILEGWWADAGESIEALLRANNLVAQKKALGRQAS